MNIINYFDWKIFPWIFLKIPFTQQQLMSSNYGPDALNIAMQEGSFYLIDVSNM